ncbi:hypothetical protein HETIRDRAFT_448176 [Heterobasidion irregulare TC 32-1]|uniref:Uncharacterized protein n=1 Tax=Heterobasidion irregulare (strain TC 32-1) TaxID=747525 RepID=W4KRN4_HETIT|nr:uncharacterized protein HETIRDRAFT_448176 [Heterobasidion irregulare TC 32-1]ETW87731.1 hypothetical protein HETIRDRAFT_448176 [Heterobasidion irregulare TC 32-1]
MRGRGEGTHRIQMWMFVRGRVLCRTCRSSSRAGSRGRRGRGWDGRLWGGEERGRGGGDHPSRRLPPRPADLPCAPSPRLPSRAPFGPPDQPPTPPPGARIRTLTLLVRGTTTGAHGRPPCPRPPREPPNAPTPSPPHRMTPPRHGADGACKPASRAPSYTQHIHFLGPTPRARITTYVLARTHARTLARDLRASHPPARPHASE